jgi:hypothetical protein
MPRGRPRKNEYERIILIDDEDFDNGINDECDESPVVHNDDDEEYEPDIEPMDDVDNM